MNIRDAIAEDHPELMVLDPEYFDEAIIGLVQRINLDVVCYDKDKVIELLCVKEGMTYEDAIEHFEFNIIGSWVGETTPVFLSKPEIL